MEWTQQILQVGKAFSGAEQTSLQDVLARQSGKFFDAFHDANLQVRSAFPVPNSATVFDVFPEAGLAGYGYRDCMHPLPSFSGKQSMMLKLPRRFAHKRLVQAHLSFSFVTKPGDRTSCQMTSNKTCWVQEVLIVVRLHRQTCNSFKCNRSQCCNIAMSSL